jgi:hypothetical protein
LLYNQQSRPESDSGKSKDMMKEYPGPPPVSHVSEKSGPVHVTNAPNMPPTIVSAQTVVKSGGGQFDWLIPHSDWPHALDRGVAAAKSEIAMIWIVPLIL